MDRFIDTVVATADRVKALTGSAKTLRISFDEWNVWYLESRFPGEANLPLQKDAPRIIEDVYSGLDAVVVGDLLTTLLNHADRVPVACLAQLVNVIAPIMTEPGGEAWKQPTFYPFAQAARTARGTALDLRVDAPTYSTKRHGDVPTVTAAATWDETDGALALFLTNRTSEPVDVTISHLGSTITLASGLELTADREPAVAGPEHAATVAAKHVRVIDVPDVRVENGATVVTLAPESWTAFEGTAARA
jgi:alpha-N-arabinofuranosidase